MPNDEAIEATPLAILPNPIRPSLFPPISDPLNCFFAHSPFRSVRSAVAICLVEAIRCPMVNSTTLRVDAPGVLHTVMPFFVASTMSILSTPTPALPMNLIPPLSFTEAEICSDGSFVALLITTASNSRSEPFAISSGSWCRKTTS